MSSQKLIRCDWCVGDPLYMEYHDTEWGVPLHNDQRLFEMLVLEGAQAGLSWLTILKKRDNYRKAFQGFNPAVVARYTTRDIQRLMSDAGIVRNRLKIESAIKNARGVMEIREKFGSLNSYLWTHVDGKPLTNEWKSLRDVPSRTNASDRMSKNLKQLGFGFVGSTICYAFMQAVGMVNDHVVGCFRHSQITRKFDRPDFTRQWDSPKR